MNFCILWWIWPGGNFKRNEWNILTCLRHLLAWQMDYIIFLLSDSFVFSCIYCIYFFSALLVMSLIYWVEHDWFFLYLICLYIPPIKIFLPKPPYFYISPLFVYIVSSNIICYDDIWLPTSLDCVPSYLGYFSLFSNGNFNEP